MKKKKKFRLLPFLLIIVLVVVVLGALGGDEEDDPEQYSPVSDVTDSAQEETDDDRGLFGDLLGSLFGFSDYGYGYGDPESANVTLQSGEPEHDMGEWTICWYLCGSDLESNGGYATADMQELFDTELPEGVRVVIQTGGSSRWYNSFVDADKLQRFVYCSDGFFLDDEQPLADMGQADTLASFLKYASTNFPAKKTAVIFWNHGGGSVAGAAFDSLYRNDSLTIDEMHEAFASVFDLSYDAPPLELVGFDTCLMGSIDVAYTFSDIARYFVGSEEVEPGNGWDYSGWSAALARSAAMDGAQLGRAICDTFYSGCESYDTEQKATLSLIDLTKLQPLVDAYERFGAECLVSACADPGFFTRFARAAQKSENYGGNTREQGYTNMVDLGDLAEQAEGLVSCSGAVLSALDGCVLYKVNGPYRAEASGLSCYYSYDGNRSDLADYISLGVGSGFKYYFDYGVNGALSAAGQSYIRNYQTQVTQQPEVEPLPVEVPDTPSEVLTLLDTDWDESPLDVDDDGVSYLTLGPTANDILAGIDFQLYYIDEERDIMMLLGSDNDMDADWENGVFSDNFRGVWGAIDGHLVYMELSYEGDDYNLYSVPILLNRELYNLQVAYSYTDERWNILGAWKGIETDGMSDKDLRQLRKGDKITTIWQLASASGDDELEMYSMDTFTYSSSTSFGETELFDGSYLMVFEMWDAAGNYAYSDPVQFDCEGGEIYTTVFS